jgi:hypothetical protein
MLLFWIGMLHVDVLPLPPSLDPYILGNTTVIAIPRNVQAEPQNYRVSSYLDFVVEQVTAGFATSVRATQMIVRIGLVFLS